MSGQVGCAGQLSDNLAGTRLRAEGRATRRGNIFLLSIELSIFLSIRPSAAPSPTPGAQKLERTRSPLISLIDDLSPNVADAAATAAAAAAAADDDRGNDRTMANLFGEIVRRESRFECGRPCELHSRHNMAPANLGDYHSDIVRRPQGHFAYLGDHRRFGPEEKTSALGACFLAFFGHDQQ